MKTDRLINLLLLPCCLISKTLPTPPFLLNNTVPLFTPPHMYTPEEFNHHVQLAYNYIENGHRKSPNRLYLLQQHIAAVSRILLPDLNVQAPDLQTIDGYFHQKQFPIVIRQDSNPICCIGTTFTLGSYASNIYNYFQEITGEAVNMQLDNVHYCSIWVIPTRIRKKRKNGTIFFQTVTQNHFQKFFRLMQTEGPF